MYCIKRDKCYQVHNTMCPFTANYSYNIIPNSPCYMTNPNIVQGGGCPYKNYTMPINYSGFQMNSMYNPNFCNNNPIGNMGVYMMPVPVEEIQD